MAREGRWVNLSTVHSTRVVLNAHPDVVEIQFSSVSCVIDLLTSVANAKGFCNGVGVSIIFEHHRRSTRFNELNDGVNL